MSSMLTSNNIVPPGRLPLPSPMASPADGAAAAAAAYEQNYLPLFPGHVAPRDQAAIPSVPQPLSHDPLSQCHPGQDLVSAAPMVPSPLDNTSALDEAVEPAVITHKTPAVKPSDAASTFSHASDYGSISTQPPPPPPQLQPLAPLPAMPVQHPQTFALPRPFYPSSANKNRPVQRIAPANTLPSSILIRTGWFFLALRSGVWYGLVPFKVVGLYVELLQNPHQRALKPLLTQTRLAFVLIELCKFNFPPRY